MSHKKPMCYDLPRPNEDPMAAGRELVHPAQRQHTQINAVTKPVVRKTSAYDLESLCLKSESHVSHRTNGKTPTVYESVKAVVNCSPLTALLIFIPFAWASHFHWKNDNLTLALSFMGIIPLEHLFNFGGEQMALYVGRRMGELIIITMNNCVAATLAIILLTKCELGMLQAYILGLIVLHIILLPGTAFMTGGARIWRQDIDLHNTPLNKILLATGVLNIFTSSMYFAVLGYDPVDKLRIASETERFRFLPTSRDLAVILLLVYVMSRIFCHNARPVISNIIESGEKEEEGSRLLRETGKIGLKFCVIFLTFIIAVLVVTEGILVESIEHVQSRYKIRAEWLGVILLPLLSFIGDATLSVLYFLRPSLFQSPKLPSKSARSVDLGVQFLLLWIPLLVLLGSLFGKSLNFIFDQHNLVVCTLGPYILLWGIVRNPEGPEPEWINGLCLFVSYIEILLSIFIGVTGHGHTRQ